MQPSNDTSVGVIRAAQYLRMSTEHQRFSIDAQKLAISKYAKEHGYEIVETYADPGRSGLSLKGRKGLQRLLTDALDRNRHFEAVLVLDVSRWGRFQDPDQAGHYEFICRQAGLQVTYCAEPFGGEPNAMASLIKQVKRVMAGEYSRELSVKYSRAHLQHARLGFRQGGILTYGFRRQVVAENGDVKMVLEPGMQKELRSDRVRIVPGPPQELAVIKTVFELYVEQGWRRIDIVRHLIAAGIPGNLGRPWTSPMLRNVLNNELCIGCFTYNRTDQKLQSSRKSNPEELWVRAKVFPPIISEELFARAQERLLNYRVKKGSTGPRRKRSTKLMMLDHLRDLITEKGRVSQSIVDRAESVPSSTTYARHFGTLRNALNAVGYVEPMCISGAHRSWSKDQLKISLRRLYDEHGFLSRELIANDASLPSAGSIRRKIGNLPQVYEFIGAPKKGPSEILQEAIARRGEKMRGRSTGRAVRRGWSANILLERMRALLARAGYLSGPLIEADPTLPSVTTIVCRFGSLSKAYGAAGWHHDRRLLARLRRARMSSFKASKPLRPSKLGQDECGSH